MLAMLAAIIPVMSWPAQAATGYVGYSTAYGMDGGAGQDGSPGKPYFISTGEELKNIGKPGGPQTQPGWDGVYADLNANYVLKADIDLKSAPFAPIAPGPNASPAFQGSLDGAKGAGECYKITNLHIPNTTSTNNIALFANIGGNANFSNLDIATANVAGVGIYRTGQANAGIPAAYTDTTGGKTGGSITNVTTRGFLTSIGNTTTGSSGGGIVGVSGGMTITG